MPSSSPRVVVSLHAARRYGERVGERLLPEAIAVRIEQDLEAGRFSRRRPRWLRDDGSVPREAGVVFAWPDGREFAWCLCETPRGVLVMATVLARAEVGGYVRGDWARRTSRTRRVFNQQQRAQEG